MNLLRFTYLISIVIFIGTPFLARWHRNKKILKKYERVLLTMVVISVLITPADYFALKWQAWHYNPDRTLNIKLATAIETYLFAIGIALIVGVVTLAFASAQDRKNRSVNPHKQRRKVARRLSTTRST